MDISARKSRKIGLEKTMTLQEADDYCTINAQKYLHWALEDEKVGMF